MNIVGENIELSVGSGYISDNSIVFFGCFIDGDITMIKSKSVLFVGCSFGRECDFIDVDVKNIEFRNCLFIGTVNIYLAEGIIFNHGETIIAKDTDVIIKVYENGDCCYSEEKLLFPRELEKMLLAPYRGEDYTYNRIQRIHTYLIKSLHIDCTPLIAGLASKAYHIVQKQALKFAYQCIIQKKVTDKWVDYIMQIIFMWVHDPMVVDNMDFISTFKKEWQYPSFDRIHSQDYYDRVDGLKSILVIASHNPRFIDEKYYSLIKKMSTNDSSKVIVELSQQIMELINNK